MKDRRNLRLFLLIVMLAILAAWLGFVVFTKSPLGLKILLLCIAMLLAVIVTRHARKTTYKCPACGHEFKISALTDFFTPHLAGQKLVKCPSCGTVDWCPTVWNRPVEKRQTR